MKDRLEISNQEIKINRMEIQSKVLSMYVQGIYSMKGTIDMSIQIPLSNLENVKTIMIPTMTGVDKKAGPSLYIRGRPVADGNIGLSPICFMHSKNQNKGNKPK